MTRSDKFAVVVLGALVILSVVVSPARAQGPVVSVSCTSAVLCVVTWTPVSGATSYDVVVFEGDGTSIHASVSGGVSGYEFDPEEHTSGTVVVTANLRGGTRIGEAVWNAYVAPPPATTTTTTLPPPSTTTTTTTTLPPPDAQGRRDCDSLVHDPLLDFFDVRVACELHNVIDAQDDTSERTDELIVSVAAVDDSVAANGDRLRRVEIAVLALLTMTATAYFVRLLGGGNL